MEDTLRDLLIQLPTGYGSLNPCFNGRYSQSDASFAVNHFTTRLNPCFNGRYSQRES